jgi:septal ring factor EnvC (AmiA/AmiB activator)
MKQDARLIKLLRLVLFLLAFCLSAMTLIIGGTAEAAPQQITMSIAQWNSLKQETNLLEAKLQIASDMLATQKNTSSELMQQLAEARVQLNETRKALNSSKSSLANAKQSLDDSKALYKTLTEQMELQRKRAKRIKHQRNLYAGCAIFAIAYAVAK